MQDAVELALENSMDIAVQRYYPWIADASILKAKAGGSGYSTPGGNYASSTAFLPSFSYDPPSPAPFSSTIAPRRQQPFHLRHGAASLAALQTHTTQFNDTAFARLRDGDEPHGELEQHAQQFDLDRQLF